MFGAKCRVMLRLLVCPALLIMIAGCGGYGEVSSGAYEYAKALYSISNRRASDRLDQVSDQIQSARESGELSEQEAGWLNDIVSDARARQWESASRASRRMLQDQVR